MRTFLIAAVVGDGAGDGLIFNETGEFKKHLREKRIQAPEDKVSADRPFKIHFVWRKNTFECEEKPKNDKAADVKKHRHF